jgi:hypothetical protein
MFMLRKSVTLPQIGENLAAVAAYDSVDSLAYPQTQVNLAVILFFSVGLLYDTICEVKGMLICYHIILLS